MDTQLQSSGRVPKKRSSSINYANVKILKNSPQVREKKVFHIMSFAQKCFQLRDSGAWVRRGGGTEQSLFCGSVNRLGWVWCVGGWISGVCGCLRGSEAVKSMFAVSQWLEERSSRISPSFLSAQVYNQDVFALCYSRYIKMMNIISKQIHHVFTEIKTTQRTCV